MSNLEGTSPASDAYMPLQGRPPADTEMAAFARPRSDEPVRIGVVGDPHLPVDETAHAKLYKPTTMAERVVADANSRDVDHLVSVGDVTREGVAEEFDVLDEVLTDLNAPFTAIPGNHDVPNDFDGHEGVAVERFADRYAPDGLPFAFDVGDVTLVGLDSASASAVSDSHDGYVPESQLTWLDEVLSRSDRVIVLVHHNLPAAIDAYDEYREIVDPSLGTPPVLRDPDGLVDVLTSHDVPLVLSGHLHVPGLTTTGDLQQVLVPSTATYPPAYLVVEIDRSGTAIKYVPVATRTEAATAYHRRCELKPKGAALSGLAASQLATFPLHQPE